MQFKFYQLPMATVSPSPSPTHKTYITQVLLVIVLEMNKYAIID